MSTEELQIESEDVYEKLTYIVDKGQEPMRIDKWVQMRIVGLTRSKLQNGIEGLLARRGVWFYLAKSCFLQSVFLKCRVNFL